VLLGMSCYASIALLFCVTVRSAGPTLAVALLYGAIESIASAILRSHRLGGIAQWLPLQIQNALTTYNQYLPSGSRAHLPLDGHPQTGALFLAEAAWVAALVIVSYRIYMKRDL
jgi:hypothetical protein